jgi:photosystem II stability/assembly factor-like uncharacterized protein
MKNEHHALSLLLAIVSCVALSPTLSYAQESDRRGGNHSNDRNRELFGGKFQNDLPGHETPDESMSKQSALSRAPASAQSAGSTSITSWQWVNPLPQGNSLIKVRSLNANTYVAIGTGSTYMKTTNAGLTWSVAYHYLGADFTINDVAYRDANDLTIVGAGRIYRTTDGGESWARHPGAVTQRYFVAVSFPDKNHGTAVGSSGTVIHTSDGGVTWVDQSIHGYDFDGVSFIDSNRGVAVGAFSSTGYIFQTTNGGATWTNRLSDIFWSGGNLADVAWLNADTVIAIGPERIARSTDGGTSWSSTILAGSGGSGISFGSRTTGAFVGFGTIYRSADAGLHWTLIDTVAHSLESVSFGSPDTGIAVGLRGGIYRTTNAGTSWTLVSQGTTAGFRGIAFANPLFGMAAGDVRDIPKPDEDRIVKTTNGGSTWQRLSISSIRNNIEFWDIAYPQPDTAIAVGVDQVACCGDTGAVIWRTVDGGATWTNPLTVGYPRLQGVSFTSGKRGTAVGWSGTVLRTTDGGATWVRQTSGVSDDLFDVFFSNESTGTAVGPGVIIQTTNGGTTWTSQTTDVELWYVTFLDANFGVALGTDFGYSIGYILRTTNGGATWDKQVAPDAAILKGISFLNPTVGVAVGLYGATYLTSDGGVSWTKKATPLTVDLRATQIVQNGSGGVVFAAGENGTIICASIPPLPQKTWTGAIDSSWNTAGNWSPTGVPLKGDSVVIPPALVNPVLYQIQQLVIISSLNILSGGKLRITEAPTQIVIKGDVIVSGTLALASAAATNIIVGGNWSVHSAGPLRKSLAIADEGFLPAKSTVRFTGNGTFGKNFFNVAFDSTSLMQSDGNVQVENQCSVVKKVLLGRLDTLVIQSNEPQSFTGGGTIVRGTVRRAINASSTQRYRFESDSSYIQFSGTGSDPSTIAVTTFPDTDATTFGGPWYVVPSNTDTLSNTIVANKVTHFSKWAMGLPRPHTLEGGGPAPLIKRAFTINSPDGSDWQARLALHYQQSEVPAGAHEDSLVLMSDTPGPPDVQMEQGWNLISVPAIVDDYRMSSLFPDAVSKEFSYEGSYQAQDSLPHGVGFWLKYPSSKTLSFIGKPIGRETLGVADKWNIIGTPSFLVRLANITALPPTTRVSAFFGYSNGTGYFVADTLLPGHGYWIKMNNAGRLILDTGLAANKSIADKLGDRPETSGSLSPGEINGKNFNVLIVKDHEESGRTLYFSSQVKNIDASNSELPPVPPGGMDVRFASNRFLEVADPQKSKTIQLQMSSLVYPIEIEWKFVSNGDKAVLVVDDKETVIEKSGSIRILKDGTSVFLRIASGSLAGIPKSFALEQNYPNPFNPVTVIRYQIPVASKVSLKIYNVLGQVVATLFDGVQDAGYREAKWDAGSVASGVYFYRIEATSIADPSFFFMNVKKMLLLK